MTHIVEIGGRFSKRSLKNDKYQLVMLSLSISRVDRSRLNHIQVCVPTFFTYYDLGLGVIWELFTVLGSYWLG